MRHCARHYLIAAALMAAPAAAQEWEVFFDSEGFEELPLGVLHGSEPSLFPHVLHGFGSYGSGSGWQLPHIVGPPDPAIGERSIRLEATFRTRWDRFVAIRYRHFDAVFGERSFNFPGTGFARGGYRAMRVSFDMYHAQDDKPGEVYWASAGGIRPRDFGEPATVQILFDETEHLEPVYDEWVHVSLTYDFERELVRGAYDGQDSGFVPMPADLMEMSAWSFHVSTRYEGGEPLPAIDPIESVWLDNLVVEVIPPCPADCDLDYEHTFFDFLCFQNMFVTGGNRADCDLDGELTFFDFVCFQDYFAAGCD